MLNRKILKRAGTVALSLALAVTCVPVSGWEVKASTSSMTSDGTKFTNPVINADVPDVDVIRVGDTYYMSSTTMNYAPGVPIMKSKDLVNWEICNYVYETMCDTDEMNLANSDGDLAGNQGNAYSKGSWASSLRCFKGTYYCSFASYTTGKTYIYRTEDIENGEWEKAEFDGVYHDMSLYFDEETDKGYLIYGGTPIKMIELNEDYTDVVKGTEQVLVEKLWPELDTIPLGEGSHMMKIDGKYYLFLITWPSDLTTEDGEEVKGGRTQLCYTSDSLTGPYERHIILNDQGAAQGQIVDTPEGDWYGMVFRDGGAIGRTPVLLPVTWTTQGAENGIRYPILGEDKKVISTLPMPKTGEARTTIVDSDEFYNQAGKETGTVREVITNGGFEEETKGWTGREGCTLSLAYSTIVSGKLGLKVSDRKATGNGPSQDITGKVKAGETYEISAKVQYRDYEGDPASSNYPDSKEFLMSIVYGDGTIKNMVSTIASKNSWAEMTGTYTIPEDADLSSVQIFIETPWTPNPDASKDLMTFYVDDVSISSEGSRFTSEDGSRLKLEWQWNHNPDDENWSLTERPGYLRIRNARTDASILHTRNTLTQRVFGPKSNAWVRMDLANMKDGDVAGLAGIQEKYGYIAVKKEAGKTWLVQSGTESKNGNGIDSWKEEKENARMEWNQEDVLLRMGFDCSGWPQTISFYYSGDQGKSWQKFGKTSEIGFELSHFVGTRFGLFNYATEEAGGYVDFDYFRTAPGEVTEGQVTVKKASVEEKTLEISGTEGTEAEIPLELEATEGDCSAIEAVLSVPDYMEVTGVDFDWEHVSGECSYELAGDSLELKVQGDQVRHSGGRFATIRLRVKENVSGEKRVQMKADSIRGIGRNIEYDVTDAAADITLIGESEILTSGSTKTPGRENPLMDHKFGADPYAITYNGRVYVYMTNDSQQYDATSKDENGNPVAENNYGSIATINVISSDDMVNWVDHGSIPVAGKNAAKNPDGIAKWANNSWAPAVAHKVIDGKDRFFLYFADNASGIGVLEADSPIGPFREPATGSKLISWGSQASEGVTWLFDPAVLVDEDGSGYLYYGGGIPGGNNPTWDQKNYPGTGRVVKLKDNMTELDGDAQVIDAPGLFEDSGIHKYNGRYYYTYCSNFSTNLPETGNGNICVMESDSPMGPFTFVGKAFNNPSQFFGIGGNNHHAFFEFEGENYFVYHAQTVGKALNLPKGGYRSTHIDAFSYDEEGHIQEITGTWEGTPQRKNLDPYARTEAETLGWSSGITTADCGEAGSYVESLNQKLTQIQSGDWAAVSSADLKEGASSFTVKAAGMAGGTLEIHLDSPEGQLAGQVEIPAGDGKTWGEYTCDVTGAEGVHDLYFVYRGDQTSISQLFELDFWRFQEKEEDPELDLEEAIRQAEEAKAAAEKAREEAEKAKEEAQTAKEEAKAAQEEAQAAEEEAARAREAAEKAKQEAEKAASQAGADSEEAKAAQAAAEEEAKKAREAQEAAKISQQEADRAKEAAQAAQKAAEEKTAQAENLLEKAEAAAKRAQAEREAAEAARLEAQAERLKAEAAAKKAEADRKAAEELLKKAQEAQKKAEEARAAAERAREEIEKAQSQESTKTSVKKVAMKSAKKAGKGKLRVKWGKTSSAAGYELQYTTDKKFTRAKTKRFGKAKTSCVLKNLKKGKTYRIRMRAYCMENGKKVYGSYSKVKKIKMK